MTVALTRIRLRARSPLMYPLTAGIVECLTRGVKKMSASLPRRLLGLTPWRLHRTSVALTMMSWLVRFDHRGFPLLSPMTKWPLRPEPRHPPDHNPRRAELRSAEVVDYSSPADEFSPWPRRSTDPPSPPPPVVTPELVRQVADQDDQCHPDEPYPPAFAEFVRQLEQWRLRLTQHFGFDSSSYASNTRRAADRIRDRISFLPRHVRQKIMDVVLNGYTIPFSEPPRPFHRQHNSPDLSEHMDAAWDALRKDLGHGAVLPCNLERDGKPTVTSPVRTAPKGWRSTKRRFVINMRHLNSFIPDDESSCALDTLSKIRNLLTFGDSRPSWFITMDMASGYHNFWLAEHQWHLMGFALHRSELPAAAITFLREHFPECEDHDSGNFYFLMRALGFGLAPSCAVFSLIMTALAASWRRHRVCAAPTRLTSYIDDFLSASLTIRQVLITAIELVYEATACGLTISVEKCRLGPASLVKFLGIVIDSRLKLFRLPASRAERITTQVAEIKSLADSGADVPAKWVAQLVGLLWSIAPCCHRAVAVMARGLIAALTETMASSVWHRHGASRSRFTLKRLLSAFWHGDVSWTPEAQRDIDFWFRVNFYLVRAPISMDTLNTMGSSIRISTADFDTSRIAFLASDASETACGGGRVLPGPSGFAYDARAAFFSPLHAGLLGASGKLWPSSGCSSPSVSWW